MTLPAIVENSKITTEEFDQIVNFSQPFVKNSKNLRKIVSLALNGWSYQISDEVENLECEDDVRVVPISKFENSKMDPDAEHRVWSIWTNSYTFIDFSLIYEGASSKFIILQKFEN